MYTVRLLRMTARLLMLLYAGFISIFALDVFEEPAGSLQSTVGLILHLLPTLLILGLVLVSRKNDLFSAISYTLLGLFYIWWAWGRFPFSTYLIIAGPVLLSGLMHGYCWTAARKEKT